MGRIGFLGLLLAVVVAASGCGLFGGVSDCGFPAGTELAYSGRATLAELGLGAGDQDSNRNAMVYVTRDPIPHQGSVPMGGEPPPDRRAYCAIFEGNVGAISERGTAPDDWLPPER
jgi:hypothetical protein